MSEAGREQLTKKRRRWLITATAIVIVLAGAGLVVIRDLDHPDARAAGCDVPAAAPTAPAGAAGNAPGGGGVAVTEQGFSQDADGRDVSMAAVLTNTSKSQVAYRTKVSFAIDDANGQNASGPQYADTLIFEIPVILPGQHLGVGAWIGLRQGSTGQRSIPVRLTVHLEHTHWLPRDGAGAIYRVVTTAVSQVGATATNDPSMTALELTVRTDYCRRVWRHWVAVLYRDRAGRLVGGSTSADTSYNYCPQRGAVTSEYREVVGHPPTLDPTRTEAYAYCDPITTQFVPDPESQNYKNP